MRCFLLVMVVVSFWTVKHTVFVSIGVRVGGVLRHLNIAGNCGHLLFSLLRRGLVEGSGLEEMSRKGMQSLPYFLVSSRSSQHRW